MANKNTIAIELIVNDNGSVTIKQFGSDAEKSLKQTESAGASADAGLSKMWVGIAAGAAAAVAAFMAVNKAMEYVEQGAKAQQAEESFRQIAGAAGESADRIIDAMKRAAAGTVDDSDIMQKAVKGMLLGFSGDELIHIMEAARIAARTTGEDVKTAYEKITDAISTNMPRALKQYGLITKDEMALVNKAMAAGTEEVNLYGIAMAHAELQAAKMGAAHANAAEGVQVFNAVVKEAKDVAGSLGITIGSHLLAEVYLLNATFDKSTGDFLRFIGATTQGNTALEMANNLTKTRNALLGIQTEEEIKAAAATAAGAKDKIAAAEANLKVEKDKLKALADQAEQAKVLQKSFEDLDKVVQEIGKDELKMASDAFNEKLKTENVTVADMSKGLDAYLTTLKSVYSERIAGEKAVAAAMAQAGSKPQDQMKQQTEILKMEKTYLVERMAGWKSYYDALSAQHSKATDLMKTKTNELKTLEDSIAARRQSSMNTMLGLQEKLAIAQGKAATDESIYMMKRQAAEQAWDAALQLSGEAKIKALQDVQKKYGELTTEVTTSGTRFNIDTMQWETGLKTVNTAQEQIGKAMTATVAIDKQIAEEENKSLNAKQAEVAAAKAWQEATAAAMESAKKEMAGYQTQIEKLSKTISDMDKVITLTMDTTQATAALAKLRADYDAIKDKNVTITINERYSSGASDVTESDNPATGVPYPSDGGGGDGGGESALGNIFSMGNIIPFGMGDIFDTPAFGMGGFIDTPAFGLGDIFDTPTYFPMARGLGLMGEAGPEAVMPLKRGRDGKLGVQASGGGQVINFNPVIHVSGGKSPEAFAREIVKPLKAEMRRLAAMN